MSEWPDLIAEFISFDDDDPFEIVKLGGAIRDPSYFSAANHGTLTAVVRYHYTPYTDVCRAPLSLFPLVWALLSLLIPFFRLPILCGFGSVTSLNSSQLSPQSIPQHSISNHSRCRYIIWSPF